jgi:hypothetical protein
VNKGYSDISTVKTKRIKRKKKKKEWLICLAECWVPFDFGVLGLILGAGWLCWPEE